MLWLGYGVFYGYGGFFYQYFDCSSFSLCTLFCLGWRLILCSKTTPVARAYWSGGLDSIFLYTVFNISHNHDKTVS